MAAEGIHKLPPINGTTDLKEALLKLGSIPRNKIMVRDSVPVSYIFMGKV